MILVKTKGSDSCGSTSCKSYSSARCDSSDGSGISGSSDMSDSIWSSENSANNDSSDSKNCQLTMSNLYFVKEPGGILYPKYQIATLLVEV